MSRASEFWNEASEERKELVEKFEKNIEFDHPKHLSGRSRRGISWCNCSWCATRVKYYSYEGPSVQNI